MALAVDRQGTLFVAFRLVLGSRYDVGREADDERDVLRVTV